MTTSPNQPSENKITIVVVSDFDSQTIELFLLAIIKSNEAYQLLAHFRDGNTARVECPQLQPDIIIIHVDVPPTNGIDLTQSLMQLCPKSKQILSSTSWSEDTLKAALQAGIRYFIDLPCQREHLDTTIHNLLNRPK